jgi:predicted nucleic acid-binding protein
MRLLKTGKVRIILILDTNVLIYLEGFFRKLGRERFRKIVRTLFLNFGIQRGEIWIPKSVRKEFLVEAKRKRKERERFLENFKKISEDLQVPLRTCPLYNKEDIEKIMTEWELDLGEADAINQGKVIVEISRDFQGFEGAIFLTNDREVEKLKGKFRGFKVSIWKDFEEKFKNLFIP